MMISTKFKSPLSKEQWGQLCPENEYRILGTQEATNLGIVHQNMNDINCVLVAASGSIDNTIMYFSIPFRVDHNAIDQEPYFELFERGSANCNLHGMIHHADYLGRTELLCQDQLDRIAASGSTVDLMFTSKPENLSGTLDQLRQEGKITGLEFTHYMGLNKK